jgi:hypothetical protein
MPAGSGGLRWLFEITPSQFNTASRPIGECPSAGSLNACAFDQAECKVGINSGFSANHGFGRFWVALSRGNARGGLNFSFFLAGPLRPVLCHPK